MARNITIREAEGSLELSKNDLDEAVFRQPQLIWLVGQEHAKALALVRDLTRDKANLAAKLDREIRDSVTKLDTKLTEKSIEMTVRDSPAMRDLNAEILAAEMQVGLWSAMIEAYRERGRSIKEAGEQYRSNYWTTESSGGDRSRIKDEGAARARTEIERTKRPSR